MRVLTLDIETSPHTVLVWGTRMQNVALNQVIQWGAPICFAAKWLGDKKVEFRSDHHDGHEVMVARAWALMDEADAIVHYNGTSFDVPHLHREFDKANLGPPTPHVDIDLLRNERKNFRNPSNKLAAVLDDLGMIGKAETGGMPLWVGCMNGDEASWRKMRAYNMQDTKQTEALYLRRLPWIRNHPNRALYDDEAKGGCPKCGSLQYIVRKHRPKATRVYRQFQCKKCLGYFTGTHSIDAVHTRSS